MRSSIQKAFQAAAALLLLFGAGAASAWPTTVRLTAAPVFRNEGTEMVLSTHRGRVLVGAQGDEEAVYQFFVDHDLKAGACLTLETETEANVVFNAGLDKSGARSIRQVACPKAPGS